MPGSCSTPTSTGADVAGRLDGKHAIVVGAGQTPGDTVGNGRAIALTFAREGATVGCVDRIAGRAQETVDLITEEGGTAYPLSADITDEAATVAMVAQALTRAPIDIVVNNVGIGVAGDGPAHRCDVGAFELTLQVNLVGTWHVVKAVLPAMRAAHAGSIVNVSSLAAFMGGHQVAYEVSKAAVNRLTLSVATANARAGVRCNAVLPGFMDTPMAVGGIATARGETLEQTRRGRDAMVPLRGGMGTAWDTAHACLYLASDEAKFVTGVLLPVDGGMSARA